VDDRGGRSLERALDAVDGWYADAHGSTDWRKAMSRRLAAECVEECLARVAV
jgi:hypothetical protein